MNATAANLMERVLPETGLRQWVLTFPFPWRLWFLIIRLGFMDRLRKGSRGSTDTRLSGGTDD